MSNYEKEVLERLTRIETKLEEKEKQNTANYNWFKFAGTQIIAIIALIKSFFY